MIIRNEEAKDFRAVEELTKLAFWNVSMPGCSEHYLAHVLRSHADFIPEMDFVAEDLLRSGGGSDSGAGGRKDHREYHVHQEPAD